MVLATVTLWISTIVIYFIVYPNLTTATVSSGEENSRTVQWPFIVRDLSSPEQKCEIPVHLGLLYPTQFSLYTNSDVTRVLINGVEIPRPFPWRNLDDLPIKIDSGRLLRSGNNIITLYLQNPSSTLSVKLFAFPKDPIVLFAIGLNLFAIASTLLLAYNCFPAALTPALAATLFLGIAVRILYVAGTPYNFRSYDLSGHVEFIKYFASHLALPSPNYGWETHQAPLYYILTGLWMHLTGQESSSWLYGQWQLLSLALSIGCLVLCIPISKLLFPDRFQRNTRILFLLLLGVFPGLVYTASRISNDALFTTISFLWLYLLLLWWKKPSQKYALALAIAIGVGILTKNTSFALGGITLICILAHSQLRIKSKVAQSVTLGVICLLLVGWYQIPRACSAVNFSLFMVGNCNGISHDAAIPRSLGNLFYFNPISLIKTPFNNTNIDTYDRQYFLEFFYKSAFFGEWAWGPYLHLISRILIASSLICLPLIAVGVYGTRTSPFRFPVYLTTLGLLSTVGIYVWLVPFSCNQDFRFVSVIIAPVMYFAILGSARHLATTLLVVIFSINCLLYLNLLTFG
jgi:hypothetical protein